MRSKAAKSESSSGHGPRASSSPTSARLLKGRPPDVDVPAAELVATETVAHPDLLAKAEDAVRPVAIQNGRMHALYLSAGFERDKNKRKLVHLDFSITLEEGCDDLIPTKVKDAWLWMLNTENKLVEVRGIPAVTLAAFINPKISKAMIHLPAAEIVKAVVSCREEVGKGQSREIERFVFRLLVERTDDVVKFAAWHDGEELWIEMPATQGEIA